MAASTLQAMTPDSVLKVKKLRPGARPPRRSTEDSSGLDLHACLGAGASLLLGRDPRRVPTGIALEIPPGYDAQVRPRSGLSLQGVGVTLGTIDSDYRGEIFVTMYLFGTRDDFRINDGDRIAQLVIARLADLPVVEVEELSDTPRGEQGHGSTGQ